VLQPDQLAGKTIGKYKIERKIGQGGMAHVYLAQDTALSRAVAIKVLDAARASDSRFVARFEREARIAAQLKHPNIVTVFDILKTEGLFLIVMEYIEGRGLDTVLRQARIQGENLDPGYTVPVIRQVAQALDYAYQHGRVVHRDIKPANILVMPNNHVKLTDFGIARALEEDSQLTTDGYLGTPFYMSPEHFKEGQIDHRSDIYSLGVVLYQMIVNVAGPFGDTSTDFTSLMYKHAHVKPLPPREVNPAINPAVEKVILKALEKEPGKRHQSGAELADDLAAAYMAPVQAGLPRWLIPALGVLAAVALLLLVLVGGLGYLAWRNLHQPATTVTVVASTAVAITTTNAVTATNAVSVANPATLYAGPGYNYAELGQLEPGQNLTLEAISPDKQWAKVTAVDATTGWLLLTGLNLDKIDLTAVPEAVVIPPTPAPATAEPTLAPTPAPTATPASVAQSTLSPSPTVTRRPTATSTATVAATIEAVTSTVTATEATAAATAAETVATPVSVPSKKTTPAKSGRVVYVQSNGAGHFLGLVSTNGDILNSNLHQFAAAPAWSPNGVQVAFFGEPAISQLKGNYSAGSGLWLLDADDPVQNPAWRLKAEDHIKTIAWSPDGTKIAYEIDVPGAIPTIVVVGAQDGAELHRFPGAQPAWSPNSQYLVIKTCAPDCGLWRVNFDGGNAQQLTFDASDSYPSWSVDDQLAFCTSRDGNWEIYTLNLSHNELSRVTNRPSTDITPVFSPDGREIYLRTDHYGGWRVTAIGLDGNNERTVKEGVGESTDWGPARPAIY